MNIPTRHSHTIHQNQCHYGWNNANEPVVQAMPGETIEFHLDDGEPLVNVTRSLKDEGHQVLLVTAKQNYFEVMVEKK